MEGAGGFHFKKYVAVSMHIGKFSRLLTVWVTTMVHFILLWLLRINSNLRHDHLRLLLVRKMSRLTLSSFLWSHFFFFVLWFSFSTVLSSEVLSSFFNELIGVPLPVAYPKDVCLELLGCKQRHIANPFPHYDVMSVSHCILGRPSFWTKGYQNLQGKMKK